MASTYRKLRARALKALFNAHTRLYQASGGWLGTSLGKLPALLLTVKGRKTGREYTTPLVYFRDGTNYVVVGSDGAARRHPQWYLNLQVNPIAKIQDGRKKLNVKARTATGDEHQRLWQLGQSINPMWQYYQQRTQRKIPVVILEPID